MARIEGVDLPKTKRIEIALTYIYGIGKSTAQSVLDNVGVDRSTKVSDLTEDDIVAIRDRISNDLVVEGDLRRKVQLNIKRLGEIGSYRGRRHRMHLPVRGQRTRTNARTSKGAKKTVAGRGRRRGARKK
ncbi:MAG TPA: 30S ribosomal protein S13 [Chloroflexi bacterium]|mgnify:FL=1|nr:30S ribosomal protein S13 [Chloroflexota bacterium]HCU97998.1 30S ribosomal protein S13 [Chloroflexota bacterium]|tara:strand:+ start:214 stop:603 length:390 start_codon:yes stop_codon:yes gene_type:complete